MVVFLGNNHCELRLPLLVEELACLQALIKSRWNNSIDKYLYIGTCIGSPISTC
jgi:hypothetical protein